MSRWVWGSLGVDLLAASLKLETKTKSGSRFGVVNLARKDDRDDGEHAALKETRHLTVGVNLATEDGLAELVLGTNGGGSVNGGSLGSGATGASHETGGSLGVGETNGGLDTSLDLVSHAAVEGGIDGALGLELGSGNPVAGSVATGEGDSGVWGVLGGLGRVDGLKTDGELGGNGLQERSNTDTGECAVKDGGVESLEVDGVVGSLEVVFELQHGGLAIGDLHVGLGDGVFGPAVVKSTGQGKVIVDIALEKSIIRGIKGGKAVRGHDGGAEREGVRDLEGWVHGEGLGEVGAQTCEEVVVEKDVLSDLLGEILHGARVGQVECGPSERDGVVEIVERGKHGVRLPDRGLLGDGTKGPGDTKRELGNVAQGRDGRGRGNRDCGHGCGFWGGGGGCGGGEEEELGASENFRCCCW